MEGRMDGWMDRGASSHPSSPPCPSAASPQPGRGLLASEQGVPRARGSSCPKPCPRPSRSQIYLRHGARPSEAPARPAAARGRGVLALVLVGAQQPEEPPRTAERWSPRKSVFSFAHCADGLTQPRNSSPTWHQGKVSSG